MPPNLAATAKEAAEIGQASLRQVALSRDEAARLDWYKQLHALCAGVSGEAAALYRATIFMGRLDPLLHLASNNPELSISFFRFQKYYEEFIQCRNNLVRAKALAEADALLLAASNIRDQADRELVILDLACRKQLLAEGYQTLTQHAQDAYVTLSRAIENANRLMARKGMPLSKIEAALHDLFSRVNSGLLALDEEKALRKYLRMVEALDSNAWTQVHEKLESFTKLLPKRSDLMTKTGGLSAASKADFDKAVVMLKKNFRGEASALKGLLMELWFWRSPAWANIKAPLLERALKDGRKLFGGADNFSLFHYEGVLLEMRAAKSRAKEIFDGVTIVARPADVDSNAITIARRYFPGPNVKFCEGHISAIVEIKAEVDISLIEQINRDANRARKTPGAFYLADPKSNTVFIINPLPPDYLQTRIIVAPELPKASKVEKLQPGIDALALTTMLNAQQLDDVAYAIMAALVAP